MECKKCGADMRKGRVVVDTQSSRGTSTSGRPVPICKLAQLSTSSFKWKVPTGDDAKDTAKGQKPRVKQVKTAIAKKPKVIHNKNLRQHHRETKSFLLYTGRMNSWRLHIANPDTCEKAEKEKQLSEQEKKGKQKGGIRN
ncbi:predicted protein [Postia placenta Mad-698-R]|uniref:Uncharacterized protein n=1 Tax=Postia placenta MAD-698-R-SB12 TaxID=670580 RepID=A0A1X6MJW2_9APHY|nr:hypothetical protein POSPLADRAFT_1159879 [Postia placenta MAD-698-R-SB12]EED79952.1 predicted protein [Postia placenta Mad-698-R]OSX56536.1 hypothetical protein POSPLADRAFT_1159879 [Postia placenta MAD-698-R-SB12]